MVEIMREADFKSVPPTGQLVTTVFADWSSDGAPRSSRGIAFVPNPLPPPVDAVNFIGRLYGPLDRAKTNLLRLEARVEASPSRTILLAAMRAREVQSSSKIEDTVAPLKDIALATLDSERDYGDATEVRRNREAIELGLRSKLPVSIRLLNDMHRVLITSPAKRPGRFRDIQAYIGSKAGGFENARFVPPPPDRVDESMRHWEMYVNPQAIQAQERVRLPLLIELALAHYQFEAIHPYSDGNGRLGRALVNITPIKNGLLRQPVCNLSEWVHEHRQEYYDHLLRVSTHGDWEGWVRFFCTALAEQADLDLQRADRVASLYDKYQILITQRRRSIMLTKLIDHLFEQQAVTIPAAAQVLGVSYTAAQRHVEFLVKQGVLKQLGKGGYHKIYLAMNIIRAIRGHGED
jgi:Fic family protein